MNVVERDRPLRRRILYRFVPWDDYRVSFKTDRQINDDRQGVLRFG